MLSACPRGCLTTPNTGSHPRAAARSMWIQPPHTPASLFSNANTDSILRGGRERAMRCAPQKAGAGLCTLGGQDWGLLQKGKCSLFEKFTFLSSSTFLP